MCRPDKQTYSSLLLETWLNEVLHTSSEVNLSSNRGPFKVQHAQSFVNISTISNCKCWHAKQYHSHHATFHKEADCTCRPLPESLPYTDAYLCLCAQRLSMHPFPLCITFTITFSASMNWLIAQGLAAFSIDKASLQSAGLSGEAIGHLYRALYVYTIGFQDKVRKLFVPVEHKQMPLNNIWRAYLAIAESAMEVGFKVYRHSVKCSTTLSIHYACKHRDCQLSLPWHMLLQESAHVEGLRMQT